MLPLIQVGLQEALQYIGAMDDASAAQPDEWRHVQYVFKNASDIEVADYAITSFDLVNITNGNIDSSWTEGDYSLSATYLNNIVTSWAANMGANYTCIQSRWYRRLFNPLSDSHPFTKVGPPERIFGLNITGQGTGSQARQVAFTTTERTTYPRHWGRNYWPFPAAGLTDSNGFALNAVTDAMATAVHDNYQLLMNNEFFPVVPVTFVDKIPTRGLLTVTEVQVDNLPDVIRKRRPKAATHKKLLPVAP